MREEILKIAEKQLKTGGFAKLNFGTIAEEFNMTRANLHYHFKNKESLAIEITKEYERTSHEGMIALKEDFKSDFFGFFQGVENVFWEQANCAGSTCICIATKLVTEKDLPVSLLDLTKVFFKDSQQVMIEVIEDAVRNGEIRKDIDAQREATRFHTIFFGMMIYGQYNGDLNDSKAKLSGLITDWANSLK